ncbi:MAG TPA: hypothetical protein VK732_05455 [Verrucomicrobiae bacterium]|nr:hypothetical protein [Verrucomicrobiae bacterium]
MIEVQYNRIGFPTINARMLLQIVIDLSIQVLARTPLASPVFFGVPTPVSLIVISSVPTHADPTAPASEPSGPVAKRETVEWHEFPTPGAATLLLTRDKRLDDRHFGRDARGIATAPAELRGRSSSMTVSAPHVALGDLRRDNRPGLSDHEKCDILTLGRAIAVVELQRDNVRLATIDARMRSQVVSQETPIVTPTGTGAIDLASDVVGAIPKVMRAPICGVAGSAVRLPRSSALASEGECRSWLQDTAPNAAPHRLVRDFDCCDRHEGPLRSGSALRSA